MMIKKSLALLGLIFAFSIPANAGFFDAQSDAVYVQYVTPAAVTGSTAAIVIDLSDTSNFPHKNTSHLRVIAADVLIDQVAAGTSTVKLGVLTSVNASSGTVNWFHTVSNALNVSNTNKNVSRYWTPAEIDLSVEGVNSTPKFLSLDKTRITPVEGRPLLWQNDIPLRTPTGGSAAPAKGDLVAEFDTTAANGAIVSIGVLYYAP